MPRSRTLASLIVENQGLAVSCLSCGHTATQDVLALSVSFGDVATLAALEPRLRCSKCGGRAEFEVWARPDKEHPKRPA